jgi:hypothetical protein
MAPCQEKGKPLRNLLFPTGNRKTLREKGKPYRKSQNLQGIRKTMKEIRIP